MKRLTFFLAVVSFWVPACPGADATNTYRAARSVHLGYPAPESELFYNEMVIEQSVPGSYFMAAGWNTGYFGVQELSGGKKVAIFSVWDPTAGNDPSKVKPEDRVEVLHSGPGVRIKRFGGEGTGGQCMMDWNWQPGETNRFLLRAVVEENKTAYSGYLYSSKEKQWIHLVTFRTLTGGTSLKGLYSFIEDFRRDGKSVGEVRRARFGEGWVRTVQGDWVPLLRARFTASGAAWESKENIDAGVADGWFYLATGGDTKRSMNLNSVKERPAGSGKGPGITLPNLQGNSAASMPALREPVLTLLASVPPH